MYLWTSSSQHRERQDLNIEISLSHTTQLREGFKPHILL